MVEYKTMIIKDSKYKDVLLDGRPITFLSRELNYNREHLSLALNRKEPCTLTLAKRIVARLKPEDGVYDYFEEYED